MNQASIEHRPFLPDVQPIARNRVSIHLLAAENDLVSCHITFWKRSEGYPQAAKTLPLQPRYHDGIHTQWAVVLDFPENAHYIKYFFCLKDHQGCIQYVTEEGLSTNKPTQGFFELLQANESATPNQPAWSRGIIYYQIFPERFAIGDPNKKRHSYAPWSATPTRENFFGGDLRGICNQLDYLQALGVECLYLTPIFEGDFNHKYATANYLKIDPDFGTEEDLQALVQSAHERGIRVLLDGVFNHCGIHFAPFESLLINGEASPYRSWFYPQSYPLSVAQGNYECVGDYPYMPRLRTVDPEVRAYLLRVMRYWLDTAQIDGWRLDVADEVDVSTWRFLRENVKASHPNALLLGETWGDASAFVTGGEPLDTVMNYLFRDAMVDFFATQRIDAKLLDQRLQHLLMKYPDSVNHALYNCLSSHDTPRFLTVCKGDRQQLMLAMAFSVLFIGSPALYYGDEQGMTGENDPDCRKPMAWQSLDTELVAWTKHLLALRKQSRAVREGKYHTLLAQGSLFAFERTFAAERVVAVFNRGNTIADFTEGAETIAVSPRSVKIIIK